MERTALERDGLESFGLEDEDDEINDSEHFKMIDGSVKCMMLLTSSTKKSHILLEHLSNILSFSHFILLILLLSAVSLSHSGISSAGAQLLFTES